MKPTGEEGKIRHSRTGHFLMPVSLLIMIAVLFSAALSGCTRLVLEEKQRALYESFEKGDINKVQYLSQKSLLDREIKELK